MYITLTVCYFWPDTQVTELESIINDAVISVVQATSVM